VVLGNSHHIKSPANPNTYHLKRNREAPEVNWTPVGFGRDTVFIGGLA
jgi:hypothetical protein